MDKKHNTCVICRKEFLAPIWRPEALTCGVACNNKRQDTARRQRTRERHDFGPRNCPECSKEFSPEPYRGGFPRVYCSKVCQSRKSGRDHARRHRAANPDADKAYRRRIRLDGNWLPALERAGYSCELCGQVEKLYVHHKDGSGETESPNHDLDNLMVLCSKCHTQIHEINFRIIDGKLYVTGTIFDVMKVDNVPVLKVGGGFDG